MYSVDLYGRVRRAWHVDGLSQIAAARLFGVDRKTVAKILEHSVPPGIRRRVPPARPKLDPFIGIIDQILEEDRGLVRKQRHTAKRIDLPWKKWSRLSERIRLIQILIEGGKNEPQTQIF